jgi:son of sevenless-like protein
LRELNSLLLKHPSTVNDDGRALINFDRYVKFMDRLNEVLDFSPPDLERYRKGGQLAYLDHQLRNIRVDAQVEESLEERSKALEAEETRDYRKRTRELQSLGFKTPS